MEAFSTSDESTSSVEASRSRARTSVLPAPGQASGRGPARVFGTSSPDSFATFDPATSSWRTSQLSLLEDSTSFSGTWPRAGMTRSGIASQLVPLAPLTGGTASGSLPTPTARDHKDGPYPAANARKSPGLGTVAHWPTPTASDGNGPGHAANGGMNLRTKVAVEEGILSPEGRRWPTPTAWLGRREAHATGNAERYHNPERSNDLSDAVAASGTSGALNPTWVEWLMGYPLGWTVSAAWETRSSRKSRNGSAAGSSRTKRK